MWLIKWFYNKAREKDKLYDKEVARNFFVSGMHYACDLCSNTEAQEKARQVAVEIASGRREIPEWWLQ